MNVALNGSGMISLDQLTADRLDANVRRFGQPDR